MTKGQVSSLADQIPEFYITTEVSPDGLIGRATGFVLAQDAGGASRIMEREVAQALDDVFGDLEFVGQIGQRLAGTAVLDATFYALTIGTISLLVAYVLATVGAIKFLFLDGPPQ